MKRNLLISTLFLAMVVLFASCNKQPEHVNTIPGDAFAVMTIKPDPGQRDEMIKSIKENDEYKDAMEEVREENEAMADLLEDFIEDPKTSGIDWEAEMYVFAAPMDENVIVGGVMKMKEADTFQKVLEKISEEMELGMDIEDEDGYKKVNFPQGLAMWNKDKILILGSDSGSGIEEKAKELLEQKANESIMSNKDFAEFYENSVDFNLWVTSNIDNMSDQINMAEKMIGFDLDDNFAHLHFDWDKKEGQFAMILKVRVNEEIRDMDPSEISELVEEMDLMDGASRLFGNGGFDDDYDDWDDYYSDEDYKQATKALDSILSEEELDSDELLKQLEEELDAEIGNME